MGLRILRGSWIACVLLGLASCEAAPVAVAPEAKQVTVAKADPPAGSREIGPLEVTHGRGCGGFGERGTYESAMAELRNETAQKGGNYVQIMTMTEPHTSTSSCFDNRFIIRGVVFQVSSPPAAELPVAKASPDASCSPPCSPGYACQAGTCIAQCNPACGPNQACRQDRTCGPASP
jgi:Domain of unknown function (DUF4156)